MEQVCIYAYDRPHSLPPDPALLLRHVQVQLVLDLTRGHTLRPASKEWRTKSTEELKMVAVSMHLQQALKVTHPYPC